MAQTGMIAIVAQSKKFFIVVRIWLLFTAQSYKIPPPSKFLDEKMPSTVSYLYNWCKYLKLNDYLYRKDDAADFYTVNLYSDWITYCALLD